MAVDKSTDLIISNGGFTINVDYFSLRTYTDSNYEGVILAHQINTGYKKDDLICDTGSYDGYVFRASADFTSGGSKPTFDKTVGALTEDNGTDWVCEISPNKCIAEFYCLTSRTNWEDCIFRHTMGSKGR